MDVVWLRYVDDVYCVIDENRCVNEMLRKLNEAVPSINFTIEQELGGKLSFLDVLINRGVNGRPEFSVFRKPTHSDCYLHAFSDQSEKVKVGVISGFFLRGYRICSPVYLQGEINYIRNVFLKLGYSNRVIDKGLFKAKQKFYNIGESLREKKENVLVLPMCDRSVEDFCQKKIQIVRMAGSKIGDLVKSKNNTYISKNAGIYAIPCDQCDKVYIGETDDFKRRSYQHNYSLRTRGKSALVSHEVSNNGHKINMGGSELIFHSDLEESRKIMEAFLISNCGGKNYNLKEGSTRVDLLMSSGLKRVTSIKTGLDNFENFIDRWKDRGGVSV